VCDTGRDKHEIVLVPRPLDRQLVTVSILRGVLGVCRRRGFLINALTLMFTTRFGGFAISDDTNERNYSCDDAAARRHLSEHGF
jgi:hypothetical protein